MRTTEEADFDLDLLDDTDGLQPRKARCSPAMLLAKAGLMPQTLAVPGQASGAAGGSSGSGGAAPGTPAVPPPLAAGAPALTLGAGAIALQGLPAPQGPPGNAGLVNLTAEQVKALQQLVAQLESRMRFLESIILLKVSAPLQVAFIQYPLATLKNYQSTTQADPYNHNLGPPHPHMLLAFLQQLATHPQPQGTDIGLQARALVILLFTLRIATMTAAEVDDICPYFAIHELAGSAMQGKVMVSWHIRGTVSLPDGQQVEELQLRARAAHEARDASPILADIQRSFTITDGIPVATARPLDLQRILLSLLCTNGCNRPVGRAPAGGPVRIIKGKGRGRGK